LRSCGAKRALRDAKIEGDVPVTSYIGYRGGISIFNRRDHSDAEGGGTGKIKFKHRIGICSGFPNIRILVRVYYIDVTKLNSRANWPYIYPELRLIKNPKVFNDNIRLTDNRLFVSCVPRLKALKDDLILSIENNIGSGKLRRVV
jgi:hypothetical protein